MQLNKNEWFHNVIYLASFLFQSFFFFLVHYICRTAQYFVQVSMRLSQKTSIISILISMDLIKEIATGVKGRNSQLFSSFDS